MIGAKKSGTNPWSFFYAPQSTIDSIRGIISISGLVYYSIFAGTDATNPLPVKLSSFEAAAQGSNALVSWTTASERNAAYFELYSSTDGKNFAAAGKRISAKGNTSAASSYSYTDINALNRASVVYYQLKSVDRDGSYTWSQVVRVSNTRKAGNSISVYPNPFKGDVSVSLPANGNASVEITTLQGELLMNTEVSTDNGTATVKGLDSLKPGIYFIKVTQNGVSHIEKLVKN
jgi:hypothetical protein